MTATLWNLIPANWQESLMSCKSEIEQIDFLLFESAQNGIHLVPSIERIFAPLTVAPEDVAVVIVGQDPYPSPEQAIGFAFAVPVDTYPVPGSLRNIFKEIKSDLGSDSTADLTLSTWVDQGALLLNTSLTTQAGVRAAHSDWPWEEIIRSLINYVVGQNPNVVALLWGAHAKRFRDLFNPHSVVESAHPSPLSASRGFLGSKPFSRTNQILIANGKLPIQW